MSIASQYVRGKGAITAQPIGISTGILLTEGLTNSLYIDEETILSELISVSIVVA